MRWVKLTLAPVVRASWLLRIWRLTSSRRAGTLRTLVAVGTERLASMLATMREAAPRRTVASWASGLAAGVASGLATGADAAATGADTGTGVGADWGAGTGAGR